MGHDVPLYQYMNTSALSSAAYTRSGDDIPTNNGRPMNVGIVGHGKSGIDIRASTEADLEHAMVTAGICGCVRSAVHTLLRESACAPRCVRVEGHPFTMFVSYANADPRSKRSEVTESASTLPRSHHGFGMV